VKSASLPQGGMDEVISCMLYVVVNSVAGGEATGRALFRQEKALPIKPSVASVRSVVKRLLPRASETLFTLIKACPAHTFLMMGLHIRSDNDHFIHHDPNNGPWKSGCMGKGG